MPSINDRVESRLPNFQVKLIMKSSNHLSPTADDNLGSETDSNHRDDLDPQPIKLDQFLKWRGLVQTGGEAKLLIQDGQVRVNGQLEIRRGRKLYPGDRVSLFGEQYAVDR
jgi:ribosome-associated protein